MWKWPFGGVAGRSMYITLEVNLSKVVWYDDSIVYTAACSALACVASYPGSRGGGEREPGTHCCV